MTRAWTLDCHGVVHEVLIGNSDVPAGSDAGMKESLTIQSDFGPIRAVSYGLLHQQISRVMAAERACAVSDQITGRSARSCVDNDGCV